MSAPVSVVRVIREIAQKTPEVAAADLNAVAAWIRARWTDDDIEYEFLSAQRVNSFGAYDFDTEARSSRWFRLREVCRQPEMKSPPAYCHPYTLPPMNVRDVLDRWAPGGLDVEERFRQSIESARLAQVVTVEGRRRQLYLGPALEAALQHEAAVPPTEIPAILRALTCCDSHCIGCANDGECEAIVIYDPKDIRP